MTKRIGRPGGDTREQLVAAALETVKQAGFAGATSRAIARTGGFNQALIYYHFGGVDALLLAALDQTSGERLERYRLAVAEARSIEDLLAVATDIRAEDAARGHTTVVAQMIAGSVARPELAPELLRRMEPWVELCEQALSKAAALTGTPVPLPLRDVAYAVATFYLGVNLLTHLDPEGRIDALMARVRELAPLLEATLGTPPGGPRSRATPPPPPEGGDAPAPRP